MAYDTTEAVAKFLSGFQMKITNRERDTVAPDYYVKYSLTLSKGGKDFDAATDCSPSRFGQGNVFADCEIQKVWDENGTLYLAGAHHDGRVSVEMRQLTDEGERLWGQLDYEDYLPLDGLTAMGKHYELGDENRFVHDLYNSPELCAAPPVTWNSPSDALLRNTRKRKGRSLTTSPPANGVCILSTPESVTVSMVA